jgi:hypothetical protein
MSYEPSFLKKHWWKALSVVLLVAVMTFGVLLYETSCSYYFEQNMHRYAMYETFSDLLYDMNGLALQVHLNKSALNSVILNTDIIDAADRMAYMDPPNAAVWSNVSFAYRGLRGLAYLQYFPSGYPQTPPDQVYQYILSLNSAIISASIGSVQLISQSPNLYGQNNNVFTLNETALQNAGHISGELIKWVTLNIGASSFR